MRVKISGRVQGVCFRAYTDQEANRLGLAGWVRNLGDGSVEAVFQGPRQTVDTMVKWCWSGPPYAKVSGVKAVEEPFDEAQSPEFSVRY